MIAKDIQEYDICLENLEKFRLSLNIEMQEIDGYANLGTNAYSRIISRKQSIKLEELISISNNIYNLKAVQILVPNAKAPLLSKLPKVISEIVKQRKGQEPRRQKKREIIQYCVLIINKHFNVGEVFTNSQIKSYLGGELEATFKGKSIEWNKSILSPFIHDTGKTRKAKTKAEKVYQLKKALPLEMVYKAKEIVGDEWLERGNSVNEIEINK